MADARLDGRDASTNTGSPERPDRGRPTNAADRVPWRVEGARRDGGQTPPQRPRLFGLRFWMVLLGLLVLNWVLSALLVRPPDRTEVPYTLFRTEVEAGNVASVTGIEDAIDGQFKSPVRVPVDDQTQEVTRFSTRQPSFAANDNLWELLTDKDVQVSAEPPPGPSLLERLLLGFGPTLLLVGLFVLLARRAAGGAAPSALLAAPGPAAMSPRPAGAPPSRTWPASTTSTTRTRSPISHAPGHSSASSRPPTWPACSPPSASRLTWDPSIVTRQTTGQARSSLGWISMAPRRSPGCCRTWPARHGCRRPSNSGQGPGRQALRSSPSRRTARCGASSVSGAPDKPGLAWASRPP
jgi:hypothetical protein